MWWSKRQGAGHCSFRNALIVAVSFCRCCPGKMLSPMAQVGPPRCMSQASDRGPPLPNGSGRAMGREHSYLGRGGDCHNLSATIIVRRRCAEAARASWPIGDCCVLAERWLSRRQHILMARVGFSCAVLQSGRIDHFPPLLGGIVPTASTQRRGHCLVPTLAAYVTAPCCLGASAGMRAPRAAMVIVTHRRLGGNALVIALCHLRRLSRCVHVSSPQIIVASFPHSQPERLRFMKDGELCRLR